MVNFPALGPLRADSALRWRPADRVLDKPSSPLRHWLRDDGSLTRRLQRLSHGNFEVRVLAEGWRRGQSRSLPGSIIAAGHHRLCWSRQVVLQGCGEPWVVAHTLIPVDSLRGNLRQLTVLNNTPLGAFLFRQRQIRRGGMEVALTGGGVWGRRSLFFRENRPLLVAEFFLPALVDRLKQPRMPIDGVRP